MNKLGGLLKKMPAAGSVFLYGNAALLGIPPFSGFFSLFMIYAAAFYGIQNFHELPVLILSICSVLALSLGVTISTAVFLKTAGLVFLGNPKTSIAEKAHDPSFLTRTALLFLTAVSICLALWAPLVVKCFMPLIGYF